MSELACLCADNLTKTMSSALPLSISGCGWRVCGFFLSEDKGEKHVFMQKVSFSVRGREISFQFIFE